jgi:hypothetical protein
MAKSETLSVRLDPETRRILAEAAPTRDAAGASALARDILERWAAETVAAQTRASLQRAVSYLRTHPDGWGDDPASFFKAKPKAKK